MSTPRQVFDHILEALKGWPSPYALDYVANLSSNATYVPATVTVWGGRCMSLFTDGTLIPGLLHQAVPLFVMQNQDDYDVDPFPGATAGRTFGSNGPRLSCLVALGPYEVQTTEFTGSTFVPNDPLTSKRADELGGSPEDAGLVSLCLGFYNDDVCGVVSRGIVTNQNQHSVLQFWTYFLPKNPINWQYY